ncbi:hypothetical protein FGB62_379g06 [Gracilaria domingensis]|nr:hypothetical protein FGB62_379g06 [Gracilaria domingensis]
MPRSGSLREAFEQPSEHSTSSPRKMKLVHLILVFSICFFCCAHASIGPPQLCRCYPPGSSAEDYPLRASSRGQCEKRVKVDIKIVADDGVILYICGQNVRQTSNFDELQEFTYEAMCDEFMLEVNNKGLSSGVSVLATYNGKTYGTTGAHQTNPIEGVGPLYASATFQPTGDWISNSPDYDYSSWTPAVLVQSILDIDESIAPNFHRLARMGAFPINTQNGDLPPGKYGLRLSVPFCG